MAQRLRHWIPNLGVLGSSHWVAPRSTSQPFIFPRSIKGVVGTPRNRVVKSKLSPRSGSVALRQLNLIHKRGHKVVFFFFSESKIMKNFYSHTVDSLYLELSRDREIRSRQRKFEIQKILRNEQFSEDLTQYSIFQRLESI